MADWADVAPGAEPARMARPLAGRFALLAAVAALVATVGAAASAPLFLRLGWIEVAGAQATAEEELLAMSGVSIGQRYIAADPRAVEARLAAEPSIARASVARLFPNGLRIQVEERRPALLLIVDTGGGQRPVYLDPEGVAFAWASGTGARPVAGRGATDALPLLSGLRFEDFKLGSRLPDDMASIAAVVGEIAAGEPGLLAAFSEIRVVKPRRGELELVLYPMNGRIPVRVGAALSPSILRSILLVLDVLGARGLADSVEEIDFRTGTVVYRIKEGQSG